MFNSDFKSKNNFSVFALVLVAVVGAVTGGIYFWQQYADPSRAGNAEFWEYQERVEEAYKNDTYGGKTPEETLQLFVAALKKEDIELASKYFALDDNLSREKWVKFLEDIKDRNLLKQMAQDIENDAKPGNSAYEGDAGFVLLNDDGTVGVQIDMELNPYTKVWKIESL